MKHTEIKIYKVGGCVRDSLLGVKSKDIDYSVEAPSFEAMYEAIKMLGAEIFLEKPEYFTIRAKWRDDAADFVLCRKEGSYYDGRHPSSVEVGTIYDDLARRDFTVNAMAQVVDDPNGTIIDPHGGMRDLQSRMIRCVGSAGERFTEDGLRMLRAIRFSITKDFILDSDIIALLINRSFWEPRLGGVSIERIREELHKCFIHNTPRTLATFDLYRSLRGYLFTTGGLWLKPTLEGR